MAQQVVIDIVAETKKLTDGIDRANGQLGGLNDKLKGVAGSALAMGSAFVLDKGIDFLKQASEEAQDAEITARNAAIAFGEGSAALEKITADAEKFAETLAVDNDELIRLSTQLSQFLPADARGLATEIVDLGYDISALTGIDVESWLKKFGKGIADGELKVADLQKMVPGLTEAIYDQAAAMFEAGDATGALNLLIEQGQKKYGDAAEKNVTATQKFEKKLGDLKEQIGTRVLPVIERLVGVAEKVLDVFLKTPEPVQNIILGLAGLIAVSGPLTTFITGLKMAMSLFTVSTAASTAATGAATIATNLLSVAMKAIPILAIIGLIVLLVQNWDTVSKVVGDVGKAIFEFGKKAFKAIGDFVDGAVKAFGDFMKDVGKFAGSILDFFLDIPKNMLNIGKNIVEGLWNGISGMVTWFRDKILGFFGNLLPGWVKDALGIKSPSKVFESIGQNIAQGTAKGLTVPKVITPTRLSAGAGIAGQNTRITINAGLGTDPYALGRAVTSAINKQGKVSNTKVVRR